MFITTSLVSIPSSVRTNNKYIRSLKPCDGPRARRDCPRLKRLHLDIQPSDTFAELASFRDTTTSHFAINSASVSGLVKWRLTRPLCAVVRLLFFDILVTKALAKNYLFRGWNTRFARYARRQQLRAMRIRQTMPSTSLTFGVSILLLLLLIIH